MGVMNTITESIVASFTDRSYPNWETEFQLEFETLRHLEDYCDFNRDAEVTLDCFSHDGMYYESLDQLP